MKAICVLLIKKAAFCPVSVKYSLLRVKYTRFHKSHKGEKFFMPDEIMQNDFSSEDNEIVRQRKDKLLRLISEEGYNPYVNETWDRQDTLESIRERFDHLQPEEEAADVTVKTAGRVMTIRRQGKATFADLADETSRMQLYFQLNNVGDKAYDFLKKWADSGDWIGVVGHPCRTRRGELIDQTIVLADIFA